MAQIEASSCFFQYYVHNKYHFEPADNNNEVHNYTRQIKVLNSGE